MPTTTLPPVIGGPESPRDPSRRTLLIATAGAGGALAAAA